MKGHGFIGDFDGKKSWAEILLEFILGVLLVTSVIVLLLHGEEFWRVMWKSVSATAERTRLNLLITNFLLCAVFAIVSRTAANVLRMRSMLFWYFGWLAWGLLYLTWLLSELLRDVPNADLVGQSGERYIVSSLSVVNSFCFLVAAFYLSKPRFLPLSTGILLLRAALVGFSFVFSMLFTLDVWIETDLSYTVENISSVFDGVVVILLGAAFWLVLKRSKRASWNKAEASWTRTATYLVVAFTAFFSLLQFGVPFWSIGDSFEQVFWVLNVVAKCMMMAIFFAVVLAERYWESIELIDVLIMNSTVGMIAVDSSWRVIKVNSEAEAVLGLKTAHIKDKLLNQILFRSLFEADLFYERLLEGPGKTSGAMKILGKRFRGPVEGKEFEDLEFIVRPLRIVGFVVGGRGRNRVFALVIVEAAES